jgi:hypothetical protein
MKSTKTEFYSLVEGEESPEYGLLWEEGGGSLVIDSNPVDFLWVSGDEMIVSKRFKEIFEEHGVKGCEYKPVKVADLDTKEPSGETLYELIITGSGGIANPDQLKRSDWRIEDVAIDKESWDGSDIFRCKETGACIFITERAKDLIEDNRLTNIRCIPIKGHP